MESFSIILLLNVIPECDEEIFSNSVFYERQADIPSTQQPIKISPDSFIENYSTVRGRKNK